MKTALITGGTSGIGLALAKQFAKHQYNLILVARNPDELEKTKTALETTFKVEVTTISSDISKHGEPEKLFATIQKRELDVDVLVNNAGIGIYGWFKDNELEKELTMIDLNMRALTILTKLFLPGMVKRKSGRILNTASTAAFQPGPHMAVYYATKAYVLSFSEALNNELKEIGVNVTALCPGPTKTGFSAGAAMEKALVFAKLQSNNVDEVARIGYEALMKEKSYVIPGFTNRILSFMTRFGSRNLITSISRKTLE